MRQKLTVTVIFMDVMKMTYHVQCVMSLHILLSIWFLPSTHVQRVWTREYYGYLMAEHYNRHRSQFICVNIAFKSVIGSSANHDGLLLYFVEGRCGSLPCLPYDGTEELSCAVCTKWFVEKMTTWLHIHTLAISIRKIQSNNSCEVLCTFSFMKSTMQWK